MRKKATPIECVLLAMADRGLKQCDLIPTVFKSRSHASQVLSGDRNLTVKMIAALHKELSIPYEMLIQ